MTNKLHVVLALFFGNLSLGFTKCQYEIKESGISPDDQDYIVNQHNYLRGLVASGQVSGQPKATNMKPMIYSMELQRKAQAVANTCLFRAFRKKGKISFYPYERSRSVEQNLHWSASTADRNGSNWEAAIQSWFNEHKTYRFGSPFLNHYTQLVWAESDNVGCGYTYYKTPGQLPYHKLYVCNYGPGGNYQGQNPYKTEE